MKNTEVKINTQNKLVESSVSSKNNDFDFDLWAAEVKKQLLAALKKAK